jgi:hypothetical protein
MDDVHQIPAGDWKYVDIPLHAKPARISANYVALNGASHVRMAFVLRQDLEWMNSDAPGILSTPQGPRGAFTDPLQRVGDYAIILDNREGRRPASVQLHVSLDFSGSSGVGQTSPRRQLIVIAVSCVAALGLVSFSANRLRRAMQ